MICKYCGIQHPPNEIANPHYCIARMEERVDKLEAALAEKDANYEVALSEWTQSRQEIMELNGEILHFQKIVSSDAERIAALEAAIKGKDAVIKVFQDDAIIRKAHIEHLEIILSEKERIIIEQADWGKCREEYQQEIVSLTAKMRKYKAFWEQSREVEKMNFERFEWEPLGEDFQKVLNEVPYEDD